MTKPISLIRQQAWTLSILHGTKFIATWSEAMVTASLGIWTRDKIISDTVHMPTELIYILQKKKYMARRFLCLQTKWQRKSLKEHYDYFSSNFIANLKILLYVISIKSDQSFEKYMSFSYIKRIIFQRKNQKQSQMPEFFFILLAWANKQFGPVCQTFPVV